LRTIPKTEAITYDKDSKTVMVDGKLTATEGITDGTTQDGQYVKMDNYVGQNLNALDQGLQTETTAREAADTQLQENIDAEAATRAAEDQKLNKKITAEKKSRIAADTKLVEAVNSGLSLSDDNVLQKNTTTIDAKGNVTTSKTDANEMILNKGNDNQITMNENGIMVGTNSTVMDKDGVYTGGDTYSEAKAALKSDGSIKGADGKFTVNSANGTVNVNDQIELNGATGVVKSNGLNVGDGNMTVSSNGNIKSAGTLSVADGNFKVNSNGGVSAAGGKTTLASDGSIKAADGKFTVNSNGGVKAADGKITLSSDGSVKAADGKFTVNSNGAVKAADGKFTVDSNGAVSAANGNTTIDSNGNLSTKGTVSAANGQFSVDTNGKITSTGLDAGSGTIRTTGTVQAGDVKTSTLETTGDATIGGNLTVEKDLTVNGEFNAKTLSSKLDENNYTEIHGGNVTSKNLKYSDTGELQASSSKMDETGSTVWARDDESIGTSTITADSVKQSLSDTGDNPTNYASREIAQNGKNKYEMTDSVVEGSQSNVTKTTADTTDSQITLKDDNGNVLNKSYITQNLKKILQGVEEGDSKTTIEQDANNITNTAANGTITNDADKILNKGATSITSQIGDGSAVKTVMDANGIANTAIGGTISNEAKDIVNTASGDITNTAKNGTITNDAKDIVNKASGNMTTTVGGDLSTKVGGNETHAVTGSQTVTVSGDRTVNVKGTETENFNAQITNIKTDQKTSVGGNQTNIVGGDQQNTVSGNKLETVKGVVTEKYGSQATTIDGDQSTNIGGSQSTVVAGDQTNTVSGNKTESVKGSVNENYGSLTTNVKNDSSLTAENINNTARNKITNRALDVETDASSSIVNRVSNDYGTNTSTQTSSETQEEMSQADGKKASYIRGAAEEKSQLVNGNTKTTIDTIADQTNTNITDGTNTSNDLQKADQIASSVTDGTNTTVVNQNAKSIASSITDGTKSNSSSNTVDQSAQVIKASDTQYSASTKTATRSEEALKNGSTILDIVKDSSTGTISAAVTDGTNLTGSTMTAKGITNSAAESIVNEIGDGSKVKSEMTAGGITNTAKDGTITNDAKDVLNKGTNSVINEVGKNQVAVKTDSVKAAYGSDTSTTWDAKGITNTTSGDISNTASGSMTNTIGKDLTTTVGGNQKTTVTGDSELTAENVKAIGKKSITSQIGEGENAAVKTVMKADGIANTATGGTISNTADKIANTATTSITDKVGDKVSRTMSTSSIEDKVGTTTVTTTDGLTKLTNEAGNHKTQMDYAEVLKDLGVRGSATVNGTSDLKGDVTMESNATVKKDLTVEGATTTKTLKVTETSEFDGAATFNDIVNMNKGLTVKGGVTADTVTADSYKVGDKTYIDANGINANNQKITNVAAGDISEGSTDAVNGGQLHATNTRVANVENRVTQVETRVDKLDNKIDKVGANAAAMANLHPLEFDADSKWNIAAAVGNSGSETASAVGVFYRPNENVMVNASASMGTGENMFGGGVSVRLGHGGNKAKEAQMKAAAAENKELRAQVNELTARMDALLSVLNPNMSKEFPDVPANHWAYEAVSRLAGNGLVEGYEDGKYHGERQMTRYEMAEIIYNALSKGAKAEKKLVEEFRPELQAMAAQKKA
jgi:trimeric autotransporter adhesin